MSFNVSFIYSFWPDERAIRIGLKGKQQTEPIASGLDNCVREHKTIKHFIYGFRVRNI